VNVVRQLLVLVAAGLAVVSAAAGAPTKEAAPVYGLLERSGPDPIARLDADTLRPVGTPLPVGAFNSVWAYSPDGTRVALAWSWNTTLGHPAAIRLADVRGWRPGRIIPLPGRVGQARALTWSRGRLLVLLDAGRRRELVAVDVASGRIVAARRLDGDVVRVVAGAGRLAVLLAPREAIGPARLAVVDTNLVVRTVALDRITAGSAWERDRPDDPNGRTRTPGLVVAPDWATAYVLSADESPAAVDLRAMSVRYGAARTLARRAKEIDGPWRFALWAGDGRLVFGGIDHSGPTAARVGVSLVETTAWASTVLDATATTATVAGGLILTWDSSPGSDRNTGLRAFTLAGAPVWAALPGSSIGDVEVSGGRALVRLSGTVATVLDLGTGKVVGTLRSSIPQLLVGRASAW
jgi:hypothetical protein